MRFDGKHPGVDAMLAAPWMVRAMADKAGKAKVEAERIAPVDTGRYKASFKVESGLRSGKAWARLSNTARSEDGFNYPAALEWGTQYMRALHIILRSIDAMRF